MVKKHLLAFFGITMAVAQVQQGGSRPTTTPANPQSSATALTQKEQEITDLKKQLNEGLSKNPKLKKLEDEKADLKKKISALQEQMNAESDKNEARLAAYQPDPNKEVPQEIRKIMEGTKTSQRKLSEYVTKLKSVEESIKNTDSGRQGTIKKLRQAKGELQKVKLSQTVKADRPL